MNWRQSVHVVMSVLLVFSLLVFSADAQQAAKKKLNIGTEGAFPPFNFFNEKNELVGYEIDFARDIAGRMGYEAAFTTGDFGGLLTSLLANKFDVIIASMTITPERKEKANFSDWYYVDGDIITVKKDNTTIKGPPDLAGKKVGATVGTTQETAAKAINEKYKLSDLKLYPSDIEGMEDLKNGRIDAFIGANLQMAYRIKAKNEPIKMVGQKLNKSYKGAALRKSDTAMLAEFNKTLAAMIKDGSLRKISEKWFGIDIHLE
jgi:ABC-type amino acid transport substrate-binding protein